MSNVETVKMARFCSYAQNLSEAFTSEITHIIEKKAVVKTHMIIMDKNFFFLFSRFTAHSLKSSRKKQINSPEKAIH